MVFQRTTTLSSTALRSVRSVAVVACACVLLHAVVVGVLALASVVACCGQHPAASRSILLVQVLLEAWA